MDSAYCCEDHVCFVQPSRLLFSYSHHSNPLSPRKPIPAHHPLVPRLARGAFFLRQLKSTTIPSATRRINTTTVPAPTTVRTCGATFARCTARR